MSQKLKSAFFNFEDGNAEWTPLKEEERKESWQRWKVNVFIREGMKRATLNTRQGPSITAARFLMREAKKALIE
jgi:hypothetical protein